MYQAAIGMGQGTHCAQRLCELNCAFFADHKILPINPYGDWNKSLLVNENIVNEVSIYLLSLGNEFTAKNLMDFLHQADIKGKYGIERDISHKTACQYLQVLGYHYQSTPKGQYVDCNAPMGGVWPDVGKGVQLLGELMGSYGEPETTRGSLVLRWTSKLGRCLT